MPDFLLRALLAGIGLALVAGPLGAFVVWRRMSYFGATMAHSALLGVALGLLLEINISLAVVVVTVVLAILIAGFERQKFLAADTVLGILAHGALALGLVALAFQETVRVDLMAYLFGDILAVTTGDLLWIYGGGTVALIVVGLIWRQLLSATVHEELARVEGVDVARVRLIFTLLLAVVIAVGLKVVGLLLVTSMLIIPAATARRLAATPEQMALGAALLGAVAVAGGLYGSLLWDTPSGPSIVIAGMALFVAVTLITPLAARWRRSLGR